MTPLEKFFPSLTLFSDIDWQAVTREYEATAIDISFPEYLQRKAEEGDCPAYLFELAYYELAAFSAKNAQDPFPYRPGVYLNPTAHFLNLTFDVPRMLEEAEKGAIEVLERPHILCLYRDREDEVNAIQLDESGLLLLQALEEGPQAGRQFVAAQLEPHYHSLVEKGLILELT